MWPITAIRKSISERRLRQECLDEILQAAQDSGIVLTRTILSNEKKQDPCSYIDNHMRRALEAVKLRGVPYILEFWVGAMYDVTRTHNYGNIRMVTPVPPGFSQVIEGVEHGIIGETLNPQYREQMNWYRGENSRILEVLDMMEKELPGTWYISIGDDAWDNRIADETGVSVIPYARQDTNTLSRLVGSMDGCDAYVFTVPGSGNEAWIRSQPIGVGAQMMYRANLDRWMSAAPEEWDEKAKTGIWCRNCNGNGFIYTGGYDEGLPEETCGTCLGSQKEHPSPYEVRELLKPQEPSFRFIKPSTDACIAQAIARGINVEWPFEPLEKAHVYMRIATG